MDALEIILENVETQLVDKIRGVLADVFNEDASEVKADLEFGDLPQWDSMGHMDVMMALEEKFGIEVNAETISDLTSIALIAEYISKEK